MPVGRHLRKTLAHPHLRAIPGSHDAWQEFCAYMLDHLDMYWPRTAAERSLGVFPANYRYPSDEAYMMDARRYGVTMDGTNQTTKLQQAVDVLAEANGGRLYLPRGTVLVDTDIDLGYLVLLIGAGRAKTFIKATSGGSFTNAVVSLIRNSGDSIVYSMGVEDMTIDANELADHALYMVQTGEDTRCNNVVLKNGSVSHWRLYSDGAHNAGSADDNPCHQSFFRDIQMFGTDTTANGIELKGVQDCVFSNITVGGDLASKYTGVGVLLDESVRNNQFIATHVEDYASPIIVSDNGNCQGNQFMGVHVNAVQFTPSVETAIDFKSGSAPFVLSSYWDGTTSSKYNTSVNIADTSDAISGETRINQLLVMADHTTTSRYSVQHDGLHKVAAPLKLNNSIRHGQYTFADADATPDVSTGNMFATANTSSTTITDFDSGFNGQKIVVFVNDANTAINENANIKLSGANIAAGSDPIFITFYQVSGTWYELHRAAH